MALSGARQKEFTLQLPVQGSPEQSAPESFGRIEILARLKGFDIEGDMGVVITLSSDSSRNPCSSAKVASGS